MRTISDVKELKRLDGPGNLRTDINGELEDMSITSFVRMLIIRMPLNQLKMGDIHCGTKILALAEGADGALDLEDSDFDWLKQAVNAYAPQLFGMNAIYLDEAIKQAEKPAQEEGE